MSSAKHPGVAVLKANKHHPRRARWKDPATGRRRVQALPKDEAEAERWLLRKSAELMTLKARSEPPAGSAMPLDLAMEKYLLERHRLRESTLRQYRYTLERFVEWMGDKQPTLARLRGWRSHLDRPGRAVASVNRDLAHVSAFLNHARAAEDVLLTRDQIADGLKRLPGDHEKKEPLSRAEIRQLLDAVSGAGQYANFVRVVLLTGMRATEALSLQRRHVDIEAKRITLGKADTKTKRGRWIDLAVSPSLLPILEDFDRWSWTKNQVRELRERLHPQFTFQRLRVTCGTYLTCAPGIYGGASAYMSAARLGHSVEVAEKHYVGVVKVPPTARTLEEAMGIADLL